MKKQLLLPVFAMLLIAAGFKTTDGIIEKLDMQHNNVQYCITGNLLGNFSSHTDNSENEFQLPYIKMMPSLVSGDKTGAAKELCI